MNSHGAERKTADNFHRSPIKPCRILRRSNGSFDGNAIATFRRILSLYRAFRFKSISYKRRNSRRTRTNEGEANKSYVQTFLSFLSVRRFQRDVNFLTFEANPTPELHEVNSWVNSMQFASQRDPKCTEIARKSKSSDYFAFFGDDYRAILIIHFAATTTSTLHRVPIKVSLTLSILSLSTLEHRTIFELDSLTLTCWRLLRRRRSLDNSKHFLRMRSKMTRERMTSGRREKGLKRVIEI